jgi:hypothetical protein
MSIIWRSDTVAVLLNPERSGKPVSKAAARPTPRLRPSEAGRASASRPLAVGRTARPA